MREAVKDYEFNDKMSVNELVNQMEKAWGFTAGKLATGVNILESMINTKGCVKFLSFTGNLVATGTRGVMRELVKR
ncbi:MAG: deoxyhypusine synthase family protein, partial [Candidatus Bathyarchaeota archaeon]|nr:deoxyhypusine synthase family protein [Candidatus Bathyarchaeota archaeon]